MTCSISIRCCSRSLQCVYAWSTRAANTTYFVTGAMATSVVQIFVHVGGFMVHRLSATCRLSLERCTSRNDRDPACSTSHVNCVAFRRKRSTSAFFMITNVSSTYHIHNLGEGSPCSVRSSNHHITSSAIRRGMGKPIRVPVC